MVQLKDSYIKSEIIHRNKLWFIWDTKRFSIHVVFGITVPLVFLVPMPMEAKMGVFWSAMLFMGLYQILEEITIHDYSYKDVQGVIGGIIMSVPILWWLS